MYVCTYVISLSVFSEIHQDIFIANRQREIISIDWQDANSIYCGRVLFYIVKLSTENLGSISESNKILNNLDCNADYNVTIVASNRAGQGPPVTTTVKTLGKLL